MNKTKNSKLTDFSKKLRTNMTKEENREKDIIRDDYFKNIGITVLRYSNFDIHNDFDGVCRDILNHLN